jgi:hypothetical protein
MHFLSQFYNLDKILGDNKIWMAPVHFRGPGSSINIVWLPPRRRPFDPPQRQRSFPLISASRTTLGPTQPPVQWVPAVLPLGVKRGWGVMLTSHPLLMPRLRTVGATPPLPQNSSTARRRTTLHFSLLIFSKSKLLFSTIRAVFHRTTVHHQTSLRALQRTYYTQTATQQWQKHRESQNIPMKSSWVSEGPTRILTELCEKLLLFKAYLKQWAKGHLDSYSNKFETYVTLYFGPQIERRRDVRSLGGGASTLSNIGPRRGEDALTLEK